jgi:[protein-PII] uridylyltransferase
VALDLFFVRDVVGNPIPEQDARWERIRDDLTRIVAAEEPAAEVAELIARRRPRSGLERRVTPGVATAVEILNDASADFTIVEVFTQDRVGVLHAITRTIAEHGLDIHLSKITTEGEKVADVFYVAHRDPGGKLTDGAAIAELDRALRDVLAEIA